MPTNLRMAVRSPRRRPRSACHKPDRQTLVPRGCVRRFLAAVPLRELRGLGGKLGERLRAATGLEPDAPSGKLAEIPLGTLQKHLGEQAGAHVWRLAQGIDNEDPLWWVVWRALALGIGTLGEARNGSAPPIMRRAGMD